MYCGVLYTIIGEYLGNVVFSSRSGKGTLMGKQDSKSSTRDNSERVGRIGPVRGGRAVPRELAREGFCRPLICSQIHSSDQIYSQPNS